MKFFKGIIFLLLLASPLASLAHIQGVSMLKINGESTLPPLALPGGEMFQGFDLDRGPRTYTTGKELTFELDVTKEPTPIDIYQKTDFLWNFGDGTPQQRIKFGTKNTHAYQKTGTFQVDIYADYASAGIKAIPEPQILQSVIVNISGDTAPKEDSPTNTSQPTQTEAKNTIDNTSQNALNTDSNTNQNNLIYWALGIISAIVVATLGIRIFKHFR